MKKMKRKISVEFVSVCLLQLSIACLTEAATDITTDQAALLALKATVTDPYRFLANNWTLSAMVCSWNGVVCSPRNRRVVALNLSYMDLEGTIPSEIGNLSFLTFLSIRANSFYGSLPDQFTSLHRLTFLDLRSNYFSGNIPRSLFNCRQLQFLSLSYNSFSGTIQEEIGNLTMLEKLYLDHNNFTGEIPKRIGELNKLENISITYNHLTGSIPSSIGNCTLLKEINFNGNNLTGSIPSEIGALRNLVILRIRENVINGDIPSLIFNISTINVILMQGNRLSGNVPLTLGLFLPNLEEISLAGNGIKGTIPSSISNASKLTYLDLSNNSLTGFIPSTLGNLRHLQVLNLANNHLESELSTPESGGFLSPFTNCNHLRKLVLSGNPLNATLVSVGNLSKSMEQFSMNNCKQRGSIPSEMGNLTSLIGLSLGGNELTGTIPKTLGRLTNLQVLYLQENELQGSIQDDLCQLDRLRELKLGGNKLVGSIPMCLADITSLRHIDLSSNNLSSTIPSFWHLQYILSINVSSNFLNGSLPEFIQPTRLEEIDLSKNLFSGEIPTSIELTTLSLAFLSLARNRLNGSIPTFLSSNLQFLDVSHNNLSGEIPKDLEKLSYLKYFDASFNELEGEIPGEGPFWYFPAQSFMMNKALCGDVRLQVPPCKNGTGNQENRLKKKTLLYSFVGLISFITVEIGMLIYFRWYQIKRRKNMLASSICLGSETHAIKRFTYLELQKATDAFSEGNLLGHGSFGSVYKGTLQDGMVVAIKVFNAGEEKSSTSFETEEVMFNARHPNLIRILCSCSSINFKALIMEYMSNGSLDKWLHTHNYHLDILRRLDIMINAAAAVKYLHYDFFKPTVHCDLKPSNILLDEDMIAHIGDFGTAKLLDPDRGDATRYSAIMYTHGYVAPEYGLYGTVSTKTDVYSFGIILLETFTGKKPTHPTFHGEMSLRRWVTESFPDELDKVIDPSLLEGEEGHFDAKMECFSSVFILALRCSAGSPLERLYMREVKAELNMIKDALIKGMLRE